MYRRRGQALGATNRTRKQDTKDASLRGAGGGRGGVSFVDLDGAGSFVNAVLRHCRLKETQARQVDDGVLLFWLRLVFLLAIVFVEKGKKKTKQKQHGLFFVFAI